MATLTKLRVDGLLREGFQGTLWDSGRGAQRGFGLRVRNGNASFVAKGRLNGRQVWLTLGGYQGTGGALTVDEARTLASAKLGDLAKGIDPNAAKREAREQEAVEQEQHSSMTFGDLAAEYLSKGPRKLAPSMWDDRCKHLRAKSDTAPAGPLTRHFGELKLQDIGRREMLAWWSAEHDGPAPLALSTGRNRIATLAAVFGFGIHELELPIQNPVDELRKALRARGGRTKSDRAERDPRRHIRPLEANELDALLEASAKLGGEQHVLTLILADAGLRMGEAIALRWCDVRFGNGPDDPSRKLEVNQARARGRHMGSPKSGRGRDVAMSRRLQAVLRAHQLAQGRPAPHELVLPTVDPANYRHRFFAKACAAAKIGPRKPKDLRDSWASQLLTCGVSLGYVSGQLGHSDPSVTARHYAKWLGDSYRVPMPIDPTREVPADLLARLPKDETPGAAQVGS